MANIPLTERLLADAGGWQVLKLARAVRDTGRVSNPVYKPPMLLGLVREGDGDYRAGLRIDSPTRIENICSCRVSRESGTICAHSVAIGLALLRPAEMANRPPASPTAPSKRPQIDLIADETATQKLHVVLPPNFIDAWKRGELTIGLEVEQYGAKIVLRENVYTTITHWQQVDKDIIEYVIHKFGAVSGMVTLEADEAAALFSILVAHPRISLGRKAFLKLRRVEVPPVLKIAFGPEGQLGVSLVPPSNGELVRTAHSLWQWERASLTLTVIIDGLAPQYSVLLTGKSISVPAEAGSMFQVVTVRRIVRTARVAIRP